MKKRKKKSVAIESNQSSSLPRACFLGQRAKQKVLFSTIKKKNTVRACRYALANAEMVPKKGAPACISHGRPAYIAFAAEIQKKKKKTAFLMS